MTADRTEQAETSAAIKALLRTEAPVPHIRCGDTVLHGPSGEEWLVAYADYETGYLAWAGWPDGRAKIAECTLVAACTDEDHAKHVASWLDLDASGDTRPQAVRRLYAPQPDSEGWIEWNGGECPVGPKQAIAARLRGGATIHVSKNAHTCWWEHDGCGLDIIAYRPVSPAQAEASAPVQSVEEMLDGYAYDAARIAALKAENAALRERNGKLVEVASAMLYEGVVSGHGHRAALALVSNGWVWPEDGPRFVNPTHERARALLQGQGGADHG